MLGIVLSGGGARGAYEIGFWKAIRRLHIKYDIVTGTSVGALNGAMMVQKSYHKAYKIWKYIEQKQIVDNIESYDKRVLIKFYLRSFFKGGASVSGLEKIVQNAVNEKKFFKSKVDFGIVTYNLSKVKPLIVKKNEMKNGYLHHYILASSTCFPFFKVKNIDENKYIDGGFYDNLPINLAIDMGATDIIAVDLKAVGFKKRVKSKNVNSIIISPRNNIGSFLEFDYNYSRKSISFGYNDTMKTFNRLDGYLFTFKKGNINKNYNKYYDKFYKIVSILFEKSSKDNFFDDFKTRNSKDVFLNIIEKCGVIFELDQSKIYNIKKYNKVLIYEVNKKRTRKSLITEFLDKKNCIKKVYDLLMDDVYSNKEKIKSENFLFHQEIILAVYLYVIS